MPRKKTKKDNETIVKVPKKRGRKPKKKPEGEENIVLVKKPKKRGRKPKGGKIIKTLITPNKNQKIKPNVILHLKCSLKDIEQNNDSISVLKYNPNVENVQSYAFNNTNKLDYEVIHKSNPDNKPRYTNNVSIKTMCNKPCQKINKKAISNNVENTPHTKDIYEKLKLLERNLHLNNISDKKSSCFWCTERFDSPPIYIPKFFLNNSYHVYGCFCSPECATAHLMKENIDMSMKFERYYLLNNIYCKIYDYKKNIKPAPDPRYILDKYYGNLSIQEYRKLLSKERLLLVVDKPLTRVLPELHQDNDDFMTNTNISSNNTSKYVIKRASAKKISKKEIISNNFGF
jgi:hypothetical protein